VCSAKGVCEAKTESLAEGFIEVIAGGDVGDERPAAESILRGADAIAVDDDGTIYVGENSRGLIRKITPEGMITTIAGNGVRGATSNTPIAGLAASVAPGDFALHDGYLYFTDTEGLRVVRMDLATNIIEFVASGFTSPRGIVVDENGNAYVGDPSANRVRRVNGMSGSVSTFAGTGSTTPSGNGGAATAAGVYGPWGVALDAEYLYISTINEDRIRRVELATGIINSYAGTGTEGFSGDDGPAGSARLNSPRHLAMDAAGNLLIADYYNGRIRKIDKAEGTISTVAGGNDCCFISEDAPADQAYLSSPSGLAIGSDDSVWVGDGRNYLLRKFTVDGNIKTIAGGGSPEGDVGTDARINAPYGLAADDDGNVIIADREASRVLRLNRKSGKITVIAGSGRKGFSGDGSLGVDADLSSPGDVAVDKDGNIYIADTSNARVRKVDLDGIISTFAGGGNSDSDAVPANMALLSSVNSLTIDSEGNLYLTEDNKVRKVDTAGIISTYAGNGTAEQSTGNGGLATEAALNNPTGMVFDTIGQLYIAESDGNVVRRVDADGIISSFAGTGASGTCGDGVDPRLGCLDQPRGLAFGGDGSLYIIDRSNQRIRRVDFETRILSSVTTGGCCLSSPRVEAHDAKLYNPLGLTSMPDGSLVFSQSSDGLIRRLSR
jgi:sugar lactone lactonase YvrE